MSGKRGGKTSEKEKSEEVQRGEKRGNKGSKLQKGREGYTVQTVRSNGPSRSFDLHC